MTIVTVSDKFHKERILVIIDNPFLGVVDRVWRWIKPIPSTYRVYVSDIMRI